MFGVECWYYLLLFLLILLMEFNWNQFDQEIEAWMKENEGNETLLREFEEETTGEEATSQEFDTFLRKRAEAVQKRD